MLKVCVILKTGKIKTKLCETRADADEFILLEHDKNGIKRADVIDLDSGKRERGITL